MSLFDPVLAWHSIPDLLRGLPISLLLFVICFITSNFVGIAVMLLRISHNYLFQWIARFYISFFRGVPMLVVLFLTYFGANMDAWSAAILSMTLIPSAFLAEYYRDALMGVSKTQFESAKALGLSKWKTMRYVVFPQAFRVVLPSLGNVSLDMFKGTSLAAMITVSEMFMHAKIISGANQDYMTIYIMIAIIYWLVCCALGWLEQVVEMHLNHVAER